MRLFAALLLLGAAALGVFAAAARGYGASADTAEPLAGLVLKVTAFDEGDGVGVGLDGCRRPAPDVVFDTHPGSPWQVEVLHAPAGPVSWSRSPPAQDASLGFLDGRFYLASAYIPLATDAGGRWLFLQTTVAVGSEQCGQAQANGAGVYGIWWATSAVRNEGPTIASGRGCMSWSRTADKTVYLYQLDDKCTLAGPPERPVVCTRYIVFDTRGSGSFEVVSAPGRRFLSELRRLKGAQRVGVIRTDYPAVGLSRFAGALLSLPAGYHNSVRAGTKWLREKLVSQRAKCGPNTRFLLTGYSQGAQVAGDVFQRGAAKDVLGMALFGDPYFNSGDLVGRGDFRRGLTGALGTRPQFGIRSDVVAGVGYSQRERVLSFCHRYDPVCQAPATYSEIARYRFSRHNNYDRLGEPEQAARYFAGLG